MSLCFIWHICRFILLCREIQSSRRLSPFIHFLSRRHSYFIHWLGAVQWCWSNFVSRFRLALPCQGLLGCSILSRMLMFNSLSIRWHWNPHHLMLKDESLYLSSYGVICPWKEPMSNRLIRTSTDWLIRPATTCISVILWGVDYNIGKWDVIWD